MLVTMTQSLGRGSKDMGFYYLEWEGGDQWNILEERGHVFTMGPVLPRPPLEDHTPLCS